MKIIIANKFIYPRGGDCICALELRRLLERKGHTVIFFAMDFPENISYPEQVYFPKEVSFSGGGVSNKIAAANRLLFGKGAEESFNRLLDDFQPDVVHLHNIHSYLSPVLAQIAHRRGVRVVWTLHDYKLICPSYSCLYNDKVCEECFDNKLPVLKKKCMKNNLLASGLAWMEAVLWSKDKLSSWTDCFVCPSAFMQKIMSKGGFPVVKMKTICNFIVDNKVSQIQSVKVDKENAYCYIGRLSTEKGIRQLLEMANKLPYKLYVAGTGPLEAELRKKYESSSIIFLGHLDSHGVVELVKRSKFMVIPSICYDNNPLSVIESLCCGTPVLGANIGGIPELLTDEYSEIFNVGDEVDFHNRVSSLFAKDINNDLLSSQSLERFSEETYYKKIMTAYSRD